MNLSMRWLSDFIKIDASAEEFARKMTMSGSKVEGITLEGSEISNVVVGRIISVKKHPEADKLFICEVDVGKPEPLQVVTGASNVHAGALAPVALNGSTLPGSVKIRKGKLRGVESNGMLCSLGELKLTKGDFPYAEEDGIFLLEEDCSPGQDIRSAIGLDDTIVEFEITSNRPDCLSVIGLARETAATFKLPFTLREPVVKGSQVKTRDFVDAVIHEPELCIRYSARAVKNVRIGPSPRWMRERLRASGVRPINNIVDITNFVCLEYGQPLHAFDYRFISGGVINIRRALPGESIVTLDGIKRALSTDMLVIADDSKPVAVAGVMGGEYSGIMPDTQTIIFESAMFNGTSIRLTSKKLGLRSEASSRFEKGLDPQITVRALDRACELVELLGAGEVAGDLIDVDYSDKTPVTVPLDPEWTNAFLGTDISEAFMKKALISLDFKLDGNTITVPSYRADVRHKADIAEEVARMFGYDNIPVTLSLGATVRGGLNAAQKFDKQIRDLMLSQGLSEITTYSFVSPKSYDTIRMPEESPLRRSVIISNPLGEDTSIMRTTLLPSMLEVLARNFAARNMKAYLFEQGTVYYPRGENDLPVEAPVLSIGMYGNKTDFYTLKGIIEELLLFVGIDEYDVAACMAEPAYHPGRCAVITVNGKRLALFGEIHPEVQNRYGINTRVYAAEIDCSLLYECARLTKEYHPLPRYPSTIRDIAVVCDEDLPVAELEKCIRSACGNILESMTLFDVYRGHQIPDGKKSAAYSINLRAQDKTLTDEEADRIMKKVVNALSDIGATIRSQ